MWQRNFNKYEKNWEECILWDKSCKYVASGLKIHVKSGSTSFPKFLDISISPSPFFGILTSPWIKSVSTSTASDSNDLFQIVVNVRG